jgi:primosomal protein N' (replication factor Y)
MREGHKHGCARRLRREMTDAERRLWFFLRDRRLCTAKFRRQHPIGPYTADFACVERRLVVELDGGQHAGGDGDARRTRCLERAGYRILRFWDNDALTRTDDVLGIILQALDADAPSPQPLSRRRERGPGHTP